MRSNASWIFCLAAFLPKVNGVIFTGALSEARFASTLTQEEQ